MYLARAVWTESTEIAFLNNTDTTIRQFILLTDLRSFDFHLCEYIESKILSLPCIL
jgi:hypothetical protein